MYKRFLFIAIFSIVMSLVFSFINFSGLFAEENSNLEESSLIAKGNDKKQSKKPVKKEKFINREAKVEQRSTKINFEDTDIAGERKGSLGSMISETQADKEVDLIKIRYNWHPEMKDSTSSLETGKSE